MTKEEIRLAIAKETEPEHQWEIFEDIYIGATQPYRKDVGYRYPAHSGWIVAKNYPEDLNAMHEVEKTLDEQEAKTYAWELFQVIRPSVTWLPRSPLHVYVIAHANASQRAEAWIRVKGLWK